MKQSKKIQQRLLRRQADYFAMTKQPRTDGWVGYKKPGGKTGKPQ